MSKSKLGSQLSYLASVNTGNSGGFNNPFESGSSIIPTTIIESTIKDIKKNKKEKKDRFTKVMEDSKKIIEDYCDDESIFEFDNYIDNYFIEDEDATLKNNLINMGRKYNRDTAQSPETTEINKAFIPNEKALSGLFDEITKDKIALQKDIESLRMSRVKNYKNLAELLAAKNQLINASLQVVKEQTSIKKTQFDLQHKVNAKKNSEEAGDSASSTSRAISNLFSLGRTNILSSVGGYESISGATNDENVNDAGISNNIYDDSDEAIQKKYFSEDSRESDGDKFLKYENMGVDYVLLIDNNGYQEVIAEDKHGNIVLDYPMPSNVKNLNFEISESTGTATDDFHRRYKVRNISDGTNEE
jgi:hypothetical protein